MTPAQLDSLIKIKHKRRGWFGRDLRIDPCPKCREGEMHYHALAASNVFVCDRCNWLEGAGRTATHWERPNQRSLLASLMTGPIPLIVAVEAVMAVVGYLYFTGWRAS